MQQQQTPPVQSIRRRARKACEPCRRRKRRCDGAQPCRACTEYEYECNYDPQVIDTAGRPPADAATNPFTNAPGGPLAHDSAASLDRNRDPETQSTGVLPATSKTVGLPGKLPYRSLLYRSLADFPRAVADTAYGQPISVPSHDFGYNVGMPATIGTASEGSPTTGRLVTAMSLDSAEIFCRLYCDTCGLLFPLIDNDLLLEEIRAMWSRPSSQLPISHAELAVTFAVLIGSYYSWPRLASKHNALFLHAQEELDRLTFRQPAMDHWLLQTWILKTLLLRLSSTPVTVWLSSCNMMQVADFIDETTQQEDLFEDSIISPEESEQRPRTIAVARALHQIISLESGRSIMSHSAVSDSTGHDENESGSVLQLQRTFQHIRESTINKTSLAATTTCLLELCRHRVASNQVLDTGTHLVEASLFCAIYRDIFRRGGSIETQAIDTIRKYLEEALNAAEKLIETDHPWFMLANFPAQATCICLALGRPLLELLPRLLGLLAAVTKKFKSEAMQRTVKTVALLVEAYLTSRDEETATIREALILLSYTSDSATLMESEVWTQFVN